MIKLSVNIFILSAIYIVVASQDTADDTVFTRHCQVALGLTDLEENNHYKALAAKSAECHEDFDDMGLEQLIAKNGNFTCNVMSQYRVQVSGHNYSEIGCGYYRNKNFRIVCLLS